MTVSEIVEILLKEKYDKPFNISGCSCGCVGGTQIPCCGAVSGSKAKGDKSE